MTNGEIYRGTRFDIGSAVPNKARAPSLLSEAGRNRLKQEQALKAVRTALKKQETYLSDEELDILEFNTHDRRNIFLKPDLSSLHPHNVREIGKGTGFNVYQVDDSRLIKVERVALRKDKKTGAMSTHYPWMTNGMHRHAFGTPQDAAERTRIHLENKKRLEEAGIKTADYRGSVVLPSLPRSTDIKISGIHSGQIDDPLMEADRLMQINRERGITPLYAEIWESVKGNPLEKNQKVVDQLYTTPEGRQLLKDVALNILKLTRQGFICDVDRNMGRISTVSRTKKGNPYPRNFILRKTPSGANELVAYDFNVGLDLKNEPWWAAELTDMEPLMRSEVDKKIYPSTERFSLMQKRIKSKFFDTPFKVLFNLANGDLQRHNHTRRERDYYLDQIDKLLGQSLVSSAILNRIEEMEGKKIEGLL